jgi:hypothetical protein
MADAFQEELAEVLRRSYTPAQLVAALKLLENPDNISLEPCEHEFDTLTHRCTRCGATRELCELLERHQSACTVG